MNDDKSEPKEFTFPIYTIGFEERSRPEEIACALVHFDFGRFGRCAVLFQERGQAEQVASIEAAARVVVEIGNHAFLLLILHTLKAGGDAYVGIDLVFPEHGGPAGKFYTIDHVLNVCRFWYHVENG